MPGFSNILVPLDGTESSELAIEAAVTAASVGASLTLVQVAEDLVEAQDEPQTSVQEAYWAAQIEPIRVYLHQAAGKVTREDLRVEVVVATGEPAEAILDIAEELAVDAVSMCSHSRSQLRQILIGSTVQSVMRELKVPLIIVHPTSGQRG